MTYEEMIEHGKDWKEANLFSSIFFVEATSCEQFYLWKEYHKTTDWEEISEGFGRTIGHIDVYPVSITFNFAKIHGKRICFYEATSRYVDHTMVEEYIKTYYPVKWDNNTRLAMTDAMNFHHAIDAAKNE